MDSHDNQEASPEISQHHTLGHDIIHQELAHAIRKHCTKSFQNFAIKLTVYPSHNAHQVFHRQNGHLVGYDKYAFEIFGQPEDIMRVRRHQHSSVLQVRRLRRWHPITKYLDHVKATAQHFPREGAAQRAYELQEQAQWWASNGKALRILALPAEIREVIYHSAMGDFVDPHPRHKARRLGPYTGRYNIPLPNINLLRTSRLIYSEASKVFYTRTAVYIDQEGVLQSLLHIPQPPRLRNVVYHFPHHTTRIRRLTLSLPHTDYFSVFGGGFDFYGNQQRPRSTAYTLRNMNLDKLTIYIAPPSSITDYGWLDDACQTTVVEWLLNVMYPFIHRHPVEIAGYAKTRQKKAFEAACGHDDGLRAFEEATRWFYDGKSEADMEFAATCKAMSALRTTAGKRALGRRRREHEIKYGMPSTERFYSSQADYEAWMALADGEAGGVDLKVGGGVAALPVKPVRFVPEYAFKPGGVTITAATPRCVCNVPCTIEEWDVDA